MRFFSQKLCICIALNDTFLSIVAHHWIHYANLVKTDVQYGRARRAGHQKWKKQTTIDTDNLQGIIPAFLF